jgi:hypothetical protein
MNKKSETHIYKFMHVKIKKSDDLKFIYLTIETKEKKKNRKEEIKYFILLVFFL